MAKTKRHLHARMLEFPESSDWKPIWTQLRLLAVERGVTTGVIVLEAFRLYLAEQKKRGHRTRHA